MKIYFVVNARLPNEKAHGIHVASMHQAFTRFGVDVRLISPHRRRGLHRFGRVGFFASSLMFMLRSLLLLLIKRMSGEQFLIYTVDMDTFSHGFLPLVGPTFAEMHSPKPATFLNRMFFKRVRGIIATTRATRDELQKTFGIAPRNIIVEPNSVDVARFKGIEKGEARTKLSLPQHEKIALYVGRVYRWKGLEILPRAFEKLSGVLGYMVGAEKEELHALTHVPIPHMLRVVGARPNEEIPLWLSAADVLIVLGTSKNEDSMRYTSPLKVFEYMAASRPIVASRTHALQEVLGEHDAFWYEPDNAESLALTIRKAVEGEAKNIDVSTHDWGSRAARIVHFMEHA